ncbi:hypothetical protein MLD38_036634 [Melastoma candidum]|uniref:Uncharacterized protein n=1 Tax=Melastoma candidum TaxID=119954 RepID=A0ACB9LM65_9MYRT|nr:hypothetical protein MLD38_036634 [Melastoma candidum]
MFCFSLVSVSGIHCQSGMDAPASPVGRTQARSLTEEEKRGFKEINWSDDEVCPWYMVRFCPHDLFVNTRSDLGPCPKIHDLTLKESFESSPRHDEYVRSSALKLSSPNSVRSW